MTNKEFLKELEKQTIKYAVKIIRLSSKLPNTPVAKVVKTNLQKLELQ